MLLAKETGRRAGARQVGCGPHRSARARRRQARAQRAPQCLSRPHLPRTLLGAIQLKAGAIEDEALHTVLALVGPQRPLDVDGHCIGLNWSDLRIANVPGRQGSDRQGGGRAPVGAAVARRPASRTSRAQAFQRASPRKRRAARRPQQSKHSSTTLTAVVLRRRLHGCPQRRIRRVPTARVVEARHEAGARRHSERVAAGPAVPAQLTGAGGAVGGTRLHQRAALAGHIAAACRQCGAVCG